MSVKVDQTDRRIVDPLIEDGRTSSSDIARRLGYSTERTVRNRPDRLVREGVIHLTAVVNTGLPPIIVKDDNRWPIPRG
jgi:DNA-binding Lrp family transcriptional regulator